MLMTVDFIQSKVVAIYEEAMALVLILSLGNDVNRMFICSSALNIHATFIFSASSAKV